MLLVANATRPGSRPISRVTVTVRKLALIADIAAYPAFRVDIGENRLHQMRQNRLCAS